ncbi:unnamed protein product [Linum trigynum]|uniref:Uncharacterized protein n=1 Tax=Linum trigynum TaxID=586398 RepID=A0AAV2EQS9_9ROSI
MGDLIVVTIPCTARPAEPPTRKQTRVIELIHSRSSTLSLWRRLIEIKFPNPTSSWRAGARSGPIGCSVWMGIMKLEADFWKLAHITPSGGAWVSFWNDCWLPGTVLRDPYPRVAAASTNQDAWVSNVISFNNESVGWDLSLSICLRGGAERERTDLINKLSLLPYGSISIGPAKLIWRPSVRGGFTVKSKYTALNKAKYASVDDFSGAVV